MPMDFVSAATAPTMSQDGGLTNFTLSFQEVSSDSMFSVDAILI